MIELTMDATLYMRCDDETGEVVQVTVQPTASVIMVMDKDDKNEEQVQRALRSAMYSPWPALKNLPGTILWEGDEL